MKMTHFPLLPALALATAAVLPAVPAIAQNDAQFGQTVPNDAARCRAGEGPAVRVDVSGIKASSGIVRLQVYRGIKEDWLVSGRWLNRIEVPARAGQMSFCMPVPRAGTYAIAVRHDLNGNGKTDLTSDGGAMSNNPSINIFNLGKPSISKTAFQAGEGVTAISVRMRYM